MNLVCCTPYSSKWPSGWRLTHSRWCPTSPNQKVRDYDRAPEPSYAETLPHPAGMALPVGGVTSARIARRHAPKCPCRHCAYVAPHSDDDDDNWGEWVEVRRG